MLCLGVLKEGQGLKAQREGWLGISLIQAFGTSCPLAGGGASPILLDLGVGDDIQQCAHTYKETSAGDLGLCCYQGLDHKQ